VAAVHTVDGRITDKILDVANGLGAELIITGAHDRGALGRFFETSIAGTVAWRSAIPVLVVHPTSDGWPPEKVVIVVDGDPDVGVVVDSGAQVAALLGVPVQLVDVQGRGVAHAGPVLAKHLSATVAAVTGSRPSVTTVEREAVPGILKAVGARPALVVAGRRWPGQPDVGHSHEVLRGLLSSHRGPCLFVPRAPSDAARRSAAAALRARAAATATDAKTKNPSSGPIVVGLNGEASSAALTWAIAAGNALGQEVIAVHAFDPRVLRPALATLAPPPTAVAEVVYRARKDLFERTWCAPLDAPGTRSRRVMVDGDAGEVLVDVALREGAAMIVVVSGGHGAISELFRESTTHGLVLHAPCPVVIVPPGYRQPDGTTGASAAHTAAAR
jgi:nucleotide-binding universal stress UspA family protein